MKSTTFFVASSFTFLFSIGAILIIPFALGADKVRDLVGDSDCAPSDDDSHPPCDDDEDTNDYENGFAGDDSADLLHEQEYQSVQIEESIQEVDALQEELDVLMVRVKVSEGIDLTEEEVKLLADADAGGDNSD